MVSTTEPDLAERAQQAYDEILGATRERIEAIRRSLRAAFTGDDRDIASRTTLGPAADEGGGHGGVGIHDLERYASSWQGLVPEDASVRAALAHRLGEAFVFSSACVPDLRRALGLDRADVAEAYERQFGHPISSVYASRTPPDPRPFWFGLPGIERPEVLHDLTSLFDWITLPSGETLCEEGDEGNSMYAVVSGRLRVVKAGEDGEEHVLAERDRGSIIGELAVLTHDARRTATIYATRDSELIALTREGFERLSQERPDVALFIMREIIDLMRGALTGSIPRSGLTGIAVVPLQPGLPLGELVEKCVQSLEGRPVLVLDRAGIDRMWGAEVADLPPDDPRNRDLVWWINVLEERHRFIFFVADPELSEWTRRCLRVADRVWLVAHADAPPEPGPVDRHLQEIEAKRATARRELVLLHSARDRPPRDTRRWLEHRRVLRHHHVCLDDAGSCARLARYAERRTVGLVLSGGAARGLAHVGVIRALEEARIPIDAVAGTSFGSIVAAAIAMGWDWESISEAMHDFAAHTRRYFRIALPVLSVMEGCHLDALFRQYYGETRIEDLWTSFFCMASNLSRSRAETLDTGPLWRAVRASMAIPSLFPPVLEDGDLLVDGGVINNMPADIMEARLEGGRVISSNAGSIDAAPEPYRYTEGVSSWRLVFERLLRRDRSQEVPNIAEVAIKTMMLSGRWAVPAQVRSSDLLIECPVGDFTMFDYEAIDELIDIGYRAAADALEDWDPEYEVAPAEPYPGGATVTASSPAAV